MLRRQPRNIRLATATAVFAAAAGMGIVNAPSAAASPEQCQVGYFCVWQNSSYTGRFYAAPGSVPNIGAFMNDRTTSYWNRTTSWVTLYSDSNYRDCMTAVPAGGSAAAIAPNLNDRMTSFTISPRPTC
ncbi:peptidase inhibitor family I36 protein [Streptomyces sp. NPDC046931]|uniref:peptidase inhibitor family I36 protein n=1 Tax=Streptomyces sp. NPDC046931 TaxID=3154806 RepID=UPI0033C08264